MLAHLLHVYGMNLDYARRLVADLSDAQMIGQPKAGMNHPAWLLGHLALSADFAAELLGVEPTSTKDHEALFGSKSKPLADATRYPPRAALLAALEKQHARVAEALLKAPPAQFALEMPDAGFRKVVPTIGDAIVFLLTAHEAIHLGQLSAWRRASGLPAV